MTPRTDLSRSPFSYPGAWTSLSRTLGTREVAPPAAVHLVTHRGGTAPILRIGFERGGTPAELLPELTPAVLRWRAPGAAASEEAGLPEPVSAEAVYLDARTILLRGSGVDLVLDPVAGCDLYPTGSGSSGGSRDAGDLRAVVVNSMRARRRYRIDVLDGALLSETTPTGRIAGPFRVTGARWLVRILEHASTDPTPADGPAPVDFDAAARTVADEFEAWCTGVVPNGLDGERALAAREAAHVTWAAIVDPEEQLSRRSILMSKNWMMRVWSWDHCFTALAVARAHPELAWDQFWTIFDHQDAWGAVPDCVNGSAPLFTFSKPPIHGWAVLELLELAPLPDPAALQAVRDALARWTEWWLRHRTAEPGPDGPRLPAYLHGNDGGWDNSTPFDAGTPLESPDLSAYLSLQAEAVAELDRRLERPDDAAHWDSVARDLRERMLYRLHDGAGFIARVADRPVPSRSLFYGLPVVLGRRLPEERLDELCTLIESHLTPHGLATEHPESPHYTPDGYWRGPMWAPAVHLIVDGLRHAGRTGLADRVTEVFLRTCERSGFAENFEGLTGDPLVDPAYTWTSAVYLLLVTPRPASAQ